MATLSTISYTRNHECTTCVSLRNLELITVYDQLAGAGLALKSCVILDTVHEVYDQLEGAGLALESGVIVMYSLSR